MHSRSQKNDKNYFHLHYWSRLSCRCPLLTRHSGQSAIARCLADNLSPYGYILDLHETDIPGINKEFTVYYRNGAYIAGTFWIANSMTIASERIVGMNGVSKQAYPIFNKSLQQCATRLSIK